MDSSGKGGYLVAEIVIIGFAETSVLDKIEVLFLKCSGTGFRKESIGLENFGLIDTPGSAGSRSTGGVISRRGIRDGTFTIHNSRF